MVINSFAYLVVVYSIELTVSLVYQRYNKWHKLEKYYIFEFFIVLNSF